MLNNLIFNKKKISIYFNYCISFLLSLFFLIYAKQSGLVNLEKYILIISLSAIFASIIYSTTIKSKLEDNTIKIGITNKSLFLIFLSMFLTSIYLGFKNIYLVFFFLY